MGQDAGIIIGTCPPVADDSVAPLIGEFAVGEIGGAASFFLCACGEPCLRAFGRRGGGEIWDGGERFLYLSGVIIPIGCGVDESAGGGFLREQAGEIAINEPSFLVPFFRPRVGEEYSDAGERLV